ncbi:MAG: hypothetical protein LBL65_01870 [Campylobacteraceae bacterium]|jgi:hypothetical protein|nr:hypothetical protein [Campylobacteraceae bacterium]
MLSLTIDFKVLYRLNLKIFFLLLSFFLLSCSGGNGNNNSSEVKGSSSDNSGIVSSDKGNSGEGLSGGGSWDKTLSLSTIDSGFPNSFNKNGLTIQKIYAGKNYHYYSTNDASSFQNSLSSRGFVIDDTGSVCNDGVVSSATGFYKYNAKRSMLGCAGIEHDFSYKDLAGYYSNFSTNLISANSSDQPSDSDLIDAFGAISGTQNTAWRAIITVDNSNARSAISSYESALSSSGFFCTAGKDISNGRMCGNISGGIQFFFGFLDNGNTLDIGWSIQKTTI